MDKLHGFQPATRELVSRLMPTSREAWGESLPGQADEEARWRALADRGLFAREALAPVRDLFRSIEIDRAAFNILRQKGAVAARDNGEWLAAARLKRLVDEVDPGSRLEPMRKLYESCCAEIPYLAWAAFRRAYYRVVPESVRHRGGAPRGPRRGKTKNAKPRQIRDR